MFVAGSRRERSACRGGRISNVFAEGRGGCVVVVVLGVSAGRGVLAAVGAAV